MDENTLIEIAVRGVGTAQIIGFLQALAAIKPSGDVELSAKVSNAPGLVASQEVPNGYETFSVTNPVVMKRSYPQKTESEIRRELYDITFDIDDRFGNMQGIHALMATMRTLLADLGLASIIAPTGGKS